MLLFNYLQIRKQWKHDHNVFDEGLLVRQAGGGKSWDGIRKVWERQVRLSYQSFSHVRVHDQFHS